MTECTEQPIAVNAKEKKAARETETLKVEIKVHIRWPGSTSLRR